MGSYMINTTNPLTAKTWSRKVTAEALRESFFGKFIGRDAKSGRLKEKDAGSLITLLDETGKEHGDSITCALRAQLQGEGVQGQDTLEGNEEALNFRNDTIQIDEKAHAVRHNTRITKQRTLHDLRKEGKDGLRDWWAETLDQTLMTHLAGDTLYAGERYNGNNTVTAPSYLLYANGASNSTETAVGADSTATPTLARFLGMANYARTKRIRPVKTEAGNYYVVFIHDETANQLRSATAAAGGTFQDFYKSSMAGGDIKKNPIFTGASFVYENMVFHQTDRLPKGINAAGTDYVDNTRRALLCGAQSALLAFGMDNDQNRMTYKEESHDYGREVGMAMSSIFGLKKARYTAVDGDQANDSSTALDFGVVVGCFYSTELTNQI